MAAGSISSVRLSAGIAAVAAATIDVQGAVNVSRTASYAKSLATGTGNNQCTLEYGKDSNIAASGNVSIDFSGSLKDALGNDAVFTKLKGILIHNRSDEFTHPTASVVLTGNFITGASLGSITSITIPPGGCWFIAAPVAGYTITNAAIDTLTITNSSGTEAADVRVEACGI